jgi:uncharacterized protein YdaU (DUF1376 family)
MARKGFYLYGRDYIGGTRRLSLEARGAYADLLILIYENEGRLAYDEDALCAELALRSVRPLRRVLTELVEAGKIIRDGQWLYNGRATRQIAQEAAARTRRNDSQPVDNGGSNTRTAASIPPSLGEVSPKFGPNFFKNVGQVVENALPFLSTPPTLSNSISKERVERDFLSAARARPGPPTGRGLGRGGGGADVLFLPLIRDPPLGRLTRIETAQARVLWALVESERLTPAEASAVIGIASDPSHPDHAHQAQRCEIVSRRKRLGWYRPSRSA